MGEPALVIAFATSRFGVRDAQLADAAAIAHVQVASWRESYRGILPAALLSAMNPVLRVPARESALRDVHQHHFVAYDRTHGDIVGYASAGLARRERTGAGELFEIYLLDRAKCYGLGRELFERACEWTRSRGHHELVVWVLEGNRHARGFYAAMGGQLAGRVTSSVRGFPVVELAYRFTL